MATTPKYDNDYVTLGYLNKTLGAESEETKTEINKIPKNYNSPPVPPYYENSLLLLNGQIYKCIKSRLVGSFNISDWKIVVSTNELDEALRFIYDVNKLEYVDQEDGVIETFYQEEDPSLNWETDIEKNKHVSDLWTIDNSICYQYEKKATNPVTYGWKRVSIPTSLFDIVDGYRKIFTEEPTNYSKDDLWLGEITKIAIESSEIFDSSHWEDRDDFIESSIIEQEEYHKVYLLPKITEINRQTQSEIKKAVDEIVLRVSQTYTTKTEVEQYIDDVKTGVAEEYTTKEEFNAQLSLTSTQINAIVEKNTQQDGNIETLNQEYASLKITSDGIKTQVSSIETEIESTNENVNNLQTEIQGVNANFNEFKDNEYINSINNLQDQIDGAIQFWNGPEIPTIENYPANEWITENEKINHQADIYTVIQDVEGEMKQGKSYRFDKINGVWQWIELTDNELSAVQAIAQDALNKSNQNTTDIETLNKKTSELEQTDSKIRASVTTLNNKYEKDITLTKQTSGNPITIEDSGAYPLEKFIVEGKSEQETRSGKNLLNSSNIEIKTSNGITSSYDKSTGIITFNGTCTADNTTFKFKNASILFTANTTKMVAYYEGGSVTNYCSFRTFDSNWGSNDNLSLLDINASTPKTRILSSKNATKTNIDVRFNNGSVADNFKVKLMITDSDDDSYEQYGISPSPDYPSEIETVKGIENLFDGNIKIGNISTTTGADLTTLLDGRYVTTDYIELKNSIAIQYKNTSTTYYQIVVYEYDEDKNFIQFQHQTLNKCIFTLSDTTKYIRLRLAGITGNTIVDYTDIMVEEGIVIHPYVPHGSRYLINKITGKNKLNKEDIKTSSSTNWTLEQITDGFKVTHNNSKIPGYPSVTYNLKPNTTYTLGSVLGNYTSSTAYVTIYYGSTWKFNFYLLTEKSKTFTTDETGIVVLNFSGVSESSYVEFKNITLNEGTDAEYEPYKEKIITYDLKKDNLFDKENVSKNVNWFILLNGKIGYAVDTKNVLVKLPIDGGKTYSIKKEITSRFRIATTNKDISELSTTSENDVSANKVDDTSDLLTINSSTNDKFLYIFGSYSDSEYETLINSLIIYESYDPYYELASIGNTKDNLEVVSGVLKKKLGKVVLDSDETWVKQTDYLFNVDNVLPSHLTTNEIVGIKSNSYVGLKTKATNTLFLNEATNYNYACGLHPNGTTIRFKDTRFTDVNELKAWLKQQYDNGNPVTVYYILAEPETIQLQPTNIELFEGYNTISTLDDLVPNTNITYLTDSKMNAQYATKSELKIESGNIKSEINATLKNEYATIEQTNAIEQKVTDSTNQIMLEVKKKVNDEDFTGANILLEINNDTSQATINADKINVAGVLTAINKDTTTTINGNKIRSGSIESNNYIINQTGMKINLDNGTIDSKNFKLLENGNVEITGKIAATSGSVGGWNINNVSIFDNSTANEFVGINKYGSGPAFYAGATETTGNDGAYRVFHDGSLYATKGTIAGNMVSSGINAGNITAGTLNIHNGSSYYLKMGFSTKHPEVSGLNITGSGGIALNGNSISGCTQIGVNVIGTYNSGVVHVNTALYADSTLYYMGWDGNYHEVAGLYSWFQSGKTDYIDVRDADGSTKLRLNFKNGLYTGYTKL